MQWLVCTCWVRTLASAFLFPAEGYLELLLIEAGDVVALSLIRIGVFFWEDFVAVDKI